MTCPSGEHVVLGTTSRGTGPIGNCGGEGNPTHYVRWEQRCSELKIVYIILKEGI